MNKKILLIIIFYFQLPIIYKSIYGFNISECENINVTANATDIIEQYTIHLDVEPQERWKEISLIKKNNISGLLNSLKNHLPNSIKQPIINYIDKNLPKLISYFGEYGEEIKGISKYTGIELGEIIFYNIFYEIFAFCTSIVIQDTHNNIFHVRNLDFGLFMGFITPYLKDLVIEISFVKDGIEQYRIHTYAGYIGALSSIKPYKYSLTLNLRWAFNGGYMGFIDWFLGNKNQHWIAIITREILKYNETFIDAYHTLSKISLISPIYFILAGVKPYEGVIITRDRNMSLYPKFLHNNSWFLVQTNYDHWTSPPFFDDRRTPAEICLNKIDREKITINNSFSVLRTKPVLNKLTTFSSFINPKKNIFYGYRQYCPDPCPAF